MANQQKSCENKPPLFIVEGVLTGVPQQLSIAVLSEIPKASSTQFTRARIYGYVFGSSTGAPPINQHPIYIGWADINNVFGNGAGQPAFTEAIAAGSGLTIGGTSPGVKYDFKNLYVVGTNGDSVLIEFEQ